MGWATRIAWRRMSYRDRVELVEALLRNRALMLDTKGRPMPGISVFGTAPTDEEFLARAKEIVEATGKDQRAAVRLIDASGEEMAEKVDRRLSDFEKGVGADERSLPRRPSVKATPQARLLGSYMHVRNILAAGDDPAAIPAIGQELPVDALGYLRAELRIMFETDDELRAFETIALELNEQALRLGHGPEQLARQEAELQTVRERLALPSKPPDLPQPPA